MIAGAVRRYEVEHRTAYQYGAPMTDGYTVACLVPRPTQWQQPRVATSLNFLNWLPSGKRRSNTGVWDCMFCLFMHPTGTFANVGDGSLRG